MIARWLVGLLLLLSALASASCGDDAGVGGAGGDPGPRGCNGDLAFCETGTTCWLDAAGDFACLPSGEGAPGDPCEHYLGFPTCQDGLVCLQLDAAVPGVCSEQCLPFEASCSTGVTCADFKSPKGAVIYACDVGNVANGGAGGGAGGG